MEVVLVLLSPLNNLCLFNTTLKHPLDLMILTMVRDLNLAVYLIKEKKKLDIIINLSSHYQGGLAQLVEHELL